MISTEVALLTEEQRKLEEEHKKIVHSYEDGDISKEEGETKIENLFKSALENGVITKEDVSNYNYRRDPPNSKYGTRSHMDFALFMKRTHVEENRTFEHLVNVLEMRGYHVDHDYHGSDEKGYVMIANFQKREDNPNKPDRKINWSGKWKLVEIKNFREEIWLKIDNLKKYKECEAYIFIRFDGLYYMFGKGTSKYLLDNRKSEPKIKMGKPAIIINKDGTNGAHYSLKQLIKNGAVKAM